MDKTNGWVAIWCMSLESEIFANAELWKTFTWCLLKSSRKHRWAPMSTGTGTTSVEIQKGQFVFGRNVAAKELSQKPSTVYKRMLKLQDMGLINIKSGSQFSIVTITKWNTYQFNIDNKCQPREQPSSKQVASREQPSSKQVAQSYTVNRVKIVDTVNTVNSDGLYTPEIEAVLEQWYSTSGKSPVNATEIGRKQIKSVVEAHGVDVCVGHFAEMKNGSVGMITNAINKTEIDKATKRLSIVSIEPSYAEEYERKKAERKANNG